MECWSEFCSAIIEKYIYEFPTKFSNFLYVDTNTY